NKMISSFFSLISMHAQFSKDDGGESISYLSYKIEYLFNYYFLFHVLVNVNRLQIVFRWHNQYQDSRPSRKMQGQ
ncbi:MAG: hypothetical protein ACTSWN_10535, partial [Promethearchaeota archaeon]